MSSTIGAAHSAPQSGNLSNPFDRQHLQVAPMPTIDSPKAKIGQKIEQCWAEVVHGTPMGFPGGMGMRTIQPNQMGRFRFLAAPADLFKNCVYMNGQDPIPPAFAPEYGVPPPDMLRSPGGWLLTITDPPLPTSPSQAKTLRPGKLDLIEHIETQNWMTILAMSIWCGILIIDPKHIRSGAGNPHHNFAEGVPKYAWNNWNGWELRCVACDSPACWSHMTSQRHPNRLDKGQH